MKLKACGRFGVHARVISVLLQIVDEMGCTCVISKNGIVKQMDAITSVMLLNIQQGDCFEISPVSSTWTAEQQETLRAKLTDLQIQIMDDEVTKC